MTAKELFEKVKKVYNVYDIKDAEPFLKSISEGSRHDIYNKNEVGYYQFLACLVKETRPNQILELGGAMGVSALMMLSELPKASTLFSVTLEEGGLEFSFVKEKYQNFVPIVGNSLDLAVWPKDCQLEETDILFIDSEHSYAQLKAELDLYGPKLKKGTIVLIDDIKLNEGMFKAWLEIEWDKFDASTLHHSGFGIAIV